MSLDLLEQAMDVEVSFPHKNPTPTYCSNQHKELLMIFRISDTFTDSLATLTRDEQKAVKATASDWDEND